MDKKFSIVAVLGVLALVGAGCSTTTTTSNPATSNNTNTSADNSASVETTNNEPAATDDTAAPQDRLNGVWVITSATGSYASASIGTAYTFDGKKSLTIGSGLLSSKGPIVKITDTGFSIMFEGMTTAFNYAYHFEGANLIIALEGSDQVLTLEKK